IAFGKAIELNPQHFGTYVGLGNCLAKMGQLDEAIAAYRRASELEPEADWIQYKLGELLQQRTQLDLEGAIASYGRAIKLNPDALQAYYNLLRIESDNWELWWQLGKALVKLEKGEKAIDPYHRAIALNPKEALIHYQLGEVLEKQEHPAEAICSYRRAIEIDPSLMSNDNSLGKALAKLLHMAQFPPQEELFLQTTNHLTDAAFVQESFCTYLKRSLEDEGIAEFVKLTRSLPRQQILAGICGSQEFNVRWGLCLSAGASESLEELYWYTGTFFAKQGLWEEAIDSYHKAIILKPEIAIAYSRWEQNLALNNKTDPQVAFRARFFNALLEQHDSADLWSSLGKLLETKSKVTEAIQAYQKSLYLQINSPVLGEVYFDLGQLLAQINQLDEAIIYFKKIVQLDPDLVENYLKIGRVLQQHNRLDDALNYYQQALNLDKSRGEIYIHIGDILSAKQKRYSAINYYYQALKMQPNQGDAYIRIGHILSQGNELEEAINYYRQALETPQVHYHAYLALANCLVQQDKLDEAVVVLQNLINHDNPCIMAEVLNHLGNILIKKGNLEEANICFQKVHPVAPPKGFYATTKEWAFASNLDHHHYTDIHPSHLAKIAPPKTIDREVHPVLAQWSKFDSPATFVATIPKGRYCQFDGRKTGYITQDNQILLDVSSFIDAEKLSELNFLPVHHLEGTVAVLSGNTSAIYYHWIIDALPKFGLMELSGIDLDSVDKFLVSSYSGFHKETLDILGIPENKIIESSKYPHVQADKMIVSSYPGIVCCPTKWATDFLRSKFLPVAAKSKSEQPERVYITRRMAGYRKIINEDEVVEVLKALGFVTITAESMSIAEKISLLSSAKVVLGLSGGGMTNLLFCSPGTKVIEIFPPHLVGMYYYLLSHHLELEYYYLIGEGIECSYLRHLIYNIDGLEDTFVNINSLKALLKRADID
ncbi:tetratricopeptide repeat protein, partial [Microcoleus anatoxicus]